MYFYVENNQRFNLGILQMNSEDTEEIRCLRKVGKNLRVQNGLTESHSNLILNGIWDEELKVCPHLFLIISVCRFYVL